MKNNIDNEIQTNPNKMNYRQRLAARKYLYSRGRQALKWTLIGVGAATIVGAVANKVTDNEEETI